MTTDYDAVKRSPFYTPSRAKPVRVQKPAGARAPKTTSSDTIARRETSNAAAFERLLSEAPYLRILKEAAEAYGIQVEGVRKYRQLIRSQLLLDGVPHEVHRSGSPVRKGPSLTNDESIVGRITLNRDTYEKVSMHIMLFDFEKEGVLKAYRIPSVALSRLHFARHYRTQKSQLSIPAYGNGKYGPFRVSWPLARPTPAEA